MTNTPLLAGLEPLDTVATDKESLNFLFGLLNYIKPKVIVEAGTYKGHFAVGAARLLPDSHIYTADINVHADLPELPNLTFYRGDFVDMLNEYQLGFDFAFIDSGPPPNVFEDPDIRTIRSQHWEVAKKLAHVYGLLVCHDMVQNSWHGGIEIAGESVRLWGGCGLSLWEKKPQTNEA